MKRKQEHVENSKGKQQQLNPNTLNASTSGQEDQIQPYSQDVEMPDVNTEQSTTPILNINYDSEEKEEAANVLSSSTNENTKEGTPKRTFTQTEIQDDKPIRSNSKTVTFDNKNQKIVNPMTHSARNLAGGLTHDNFQGKDAMKIAVVSREGHGSMRKGWQVKQGTKGFYQVKTNKVVSKAETKVEGNPNTNKMTEETKGGLISNVKKNSPVNNMDEAFTQFFENKDVPHVIAVVEGKGKDLPNTLTLKDTEDREYTYEKDEFRIKGRNSDTRRNDNQDMHFYKRTDMKSAIDIKETMIPREEEEFQVAEVGWKTKNGNYSMLVTHIPNDYTGGKKDDITHQALQNYANEQQQQHKKTVVGYTGDTNYKKSMQEFSTPSVGGNQGPTYVTSASSGNKTKFTQFMQTNTFGNNQSSYRVGQPSTLNYVEYENTNVTTGIDHPSIQTTVMLDSEIIGRDLSYSPIKKVKTTSQSQNIDEEEFKDAKDPKDLEMPEDEEEFGDPEEAENEQESEIEQESENGEESENEQESENGEESENEQESENGEESENEERHKNKRKFKDEEESDRSESENEKINAANDKRAFRAQPNINNNTTTQSSINTFKKIKSEFTAINTRRVEEDEEKEEDRTSGMKCQ